MPQSVPGTWGVGGYNLPDFGFTELLRQMMGKTASAEATTLFNNPNVIRAIQGSTAPYVPGKPSVLGTNTSNGGGNNGAGAGYNYDSNGTRVERDVNAGGGNANEVALAEMARRNRINSYKAQAGNVRSTAQGNFDNILKAVNAFRERNKTLNANAGQEITNRAADILGSNARTGRELEGETRAKGRAFGLGDSSKFLNQGKLAANLAATQGNTLAKRGEEERSNQDLFQQRQDEAQGQENEAGTYLRNAQDRASQIENLGYDAGEEQFANSLNDIVNYQRSLASINPVNASGLTSYSPDFSGITNTLNSILTGQGQNVGADEGTANPVNPTDYLSLLRKKQNFYAA